TADRLVVIGKGRLIASTTVTDFIGRSGGATVRVRSPRLDELHTVLVAAGLTVQRDGAALTAHNATTDAVGDLAAQHSIPLHELSSQQVSLEQAYLSLTDDATEYRGRPQ
ncbi:export ABC transporter ATP-binding protein, partial [Mycobacterium sp. ITM-2017-0098]